MELNSGFGHRKSHDSASWRDGDVATCRALVQELQYMMCEHLFRCARWDLSDDHNK